MKYTNFVFLLILLFLAACSGEAYIQVKNNTPEMILVSVNRNPEEVLQPNELTESYTVSVSRGVINYIPVSASGEWLDNYNESVGLACGDAVVHRINSQLADLTFVNSSIDSAILRYENALYLYFAGKESKRVKHAVDGNVTLDYEGRYIFLQHEVKYWFPGQEYRFELIPDACEIQLNNLHPNRAIYYVYISPSTSDTWGSDKLGANTIVYPAEGYVWKAEGDIKWDMRVEAGDPHPDSLLFVYEYYDLDACASDYTWIYEFPRIFSALKKESFSKRAPTNNALLKAHALHKDAFAEESAYRIENIGKKDLHHRTKAFLKE